jgi:hypothetical protein
MTEYARIGRRGACLVLERHSGGLTRGRHTGTPVSLPISPHPLMKPLRMPLTALALCLATEASGTPATPPEASGPPPSVQAGPLPPEPAASATLASQANDSTAAMGTAGASLNVPPPPTAPPAIAATGEMPWTGMLLVGVLVVLLVGLRRRPDR